jgi:hypothetical protein
MTYERLPYEDASTATEMSTDCEAVGSALRLPDRRTPAERARAAAVRPAPSIRFEDYPREVDKPAIRVSEAASRLAAAFHSYLD